MDELPNFDVRHEGRAWTREEIASRWRTPPLPEKIELMDGKIFLAEEQRLAMLGCLLENVGADAAVRLGDPEVWREAIDRLEASDQT